MSDRPRDEEDPRPEDAAGPAPGADRLASLGMLVASVAHEVNNPITYVLGNLGELERITAAMREALLCYRAQAGSEAARDAERKLEDAGGLDVLEELFADTYEGATRIRDVVRDLLNLSRPSGRVSELVNVHDVLNSTLRLVSRRLEPVAKLSLEYDATQWVSGDRAQLGGVFLNLISNAIQACEPPDPAQHRVAVRTFDQESHVVIEIEDSGVGVPSANREEIFSPFFTTKELGRGNGLGLFISRRMVEDHGGTLAFRERRGGGTIFRVELPALPDDATPPGFP